MFEKFSGNNTGVTQSHFASYFSCCDWYPPSFKNAVWKLKYLLKAAFSWWHLRATDHCQAWKV